MLQADSFILMVAGGFLILLGLGAVIWDKRERKGYYNGVATRADVREYMEHEPLRPEHGALKIGGGLAIGIGLILFVMGGVFWLVG